jgi:hypothetical protein
MIELFIVGSLVIAIVRTSKGRGSSPWLFGSVAVLGYLLAGRVLASVLGGLLSEESSSAAIIAFRLTVGIVPFAWLVLVYFYVRFVSGRSHIQPAGQWTCPECRWLNSAALFKCEACGHEYQTKSFKDLSTTAG